MRLLLLDTSLQVEVAYDAEQRDDADTVCLTFAEHCPTDERIFKADETRIFLTPDQAEQLARARMQVGRLKRSAGAAQKRKSRLTTSSMRYGMQPLKRGDRFLNADLVTEYTVVAPCIT